MEQVSSQTTPRPRQTSRLLDLPSHILTQVALELLYDSKPQPSSLPRDRSPKLPVHKSDLLDPSSIEDFLAFTRVCAATRYLDIPSAIWRELTLHQARRFQVEKVGRWKASPTGGGNCSQLWIALDEDIMERVQVALAQVSFSPLSSPISGAPGKAVEDEIVAGCTTQDVWRWWAYSPGWRSKRRVWHCVVHAAATARDADWW